MCGGVCEGGVSALKWLLLTREILFSVKIKLMLNAEYWMTLVEFAREAETEMIEPKSAGRKMLA